MFHRRRFLAQTLKGSSLVAMSALVPEWVARTAQAAAPGKDNILVVLELSGGNDGLNTVIPYADDLYHKARPTLRQTKEAVIRLDDHVGLHSGLKALQPFWQRGELAVVQGVGYPNPQRSHFEAMDIWQSADPSGATKTGWLGRAVAGAENRTGGIPILHVAAGRLPLALTGAGGGSAVTIDSKSSFRLNLDGSDAGQQQARRKLLEDLAAPSGRGDDGDELLSFVQRRQVQTLTALEQLRSLLEGAGAVDRSGSGLHQKLQLVAGLIARGFGTRIFYVNLDGFDTHAGQGPAHVALFGDLAGAIAGFFESLKATQNDRRVRLMTYSEFGRRVQENGSKGTDHGAASCLFVTGPSVEGGVVGKHPSLSDLDADDLKYHTDFRRVYATMLDDWLGCDSKSVLGAKWDHVKELAL